VILKVAEFRSITAAATNLDMRTATASAALKRVEKALGVELFIRTTRRLRLSSAGERYIPQCEQALLMLDHARQNMKDDLVRPGVWPVKVWRLNPASICPRICYQERLSASCLSSNPSLLNYGLSARVDNRLHRLFDCSETPLERKVQTF
jgi:hypothetical protein